ncbi:MAG: hypothetical protein KDG56_07990, partial [Ottowia sp.]|nr:hypothetical protein [Ottowia sp.]
GKWGRLSFAYFSLATQRKVGAPPGAYPGLQRHQKYYAFNSCLRPPRLGKTPIQFKKMPLPRKADRTAESAAPPNGALAGTWQELAKVLGQSQPERLVSLGQTAGFREKSTSRPGMTGAASYQ